MRPVLALVAALVAVSLAPASASAAFHWGGPIAADTAGAGPALDAVACTAPTACTALTTSGGAVSFDPQAPAPSTPVTVDGSAPTALSCPAAGRCVSVDLSGGEATFDPGNPSGGASAAIDASHALTGLVCTAPSACVAVDASGQEVSFDPGAPGGSAVRSVDSGQLMTAVSCPDPTLCAAVDGGGRDVVFNPVTGTVSSQATLDYLNGGPRALTALACPSDQKCVAVDGKGGEFAFNPQNPGSLTSLTVDPGHALIAVACPDTSHCTAIDDGGGEVTFAPGAPGTRRPIDSAASLAALSCTSDSGCVAVTTQGREISFDPAAGSLGAGGLIDAIGSYTAVACAGPAQCTAADRAGAVVTFDPQSGVTLASGTVDPGTELVSAMACPAVSQCTLTDLGGNVVTFDPRAPGTPPITSLVRSHPLLAIACPTASQCTVVDDDRDEITFNPQSPSGATYALLSTPAQTSLTGVACPTAGQCTAVDGAGNAVTFDPAAPGHPAAHDVLPDGAVALSCPALSVCVAVDATGRRATFAPDAPASVDTARIDLARLGTVACLTGTYCLSTDASGNATEFDPHGAGTIGVTPIGAPGDITALACPSAQECVVVDSSGHALLGTTSLPPVPGAAGAPVIAGRARLGATLSATAGSWTVAPTGYLRQWLRCTAAGLFCQAISGATTATLTLTADDVGHALVLRILASDQAGFGATQISQPTRRVAPALSGPDVSAARLATTGRGAPRLTLTVTAARYGPTLRSLALTLPSGLRVVTRPDRRRFGATIPGLELTVGRHGARARAHVTRTGLTIVLAHPQSRLSVRLGAPGLALSAALRRRLHRRPVPVLRLAVAITGHGRPLRTGTTLRLR